MATIPPTAPVTTAATAPIGCPNQPTKHPATIPITAMAVSATTAHAANRSLSPSVTTQARYPSKIRIRITTTTITNTRSMDMGLLYWQTTGMLSLVRRGNMMLRGF